MRTTPRIAIAAIGTADSHIFEGLRGAIGRMNSDTDGLG